MIYFNSSFVDDEDRRQLALHTWYKTWLRSLTTEEYQYVLERFMVVLYGQIGVNVKEIGDHLTSLISNHLGAVSNSVIKHLGKCLQHA